MTTTAIRKSQYIVQAAAGTSCPECRSEPRLLVREDGEIKRQWPAFYLCRCGFIGQVGVGPVEDLTK